MKVTSLIFIALILGGCNPFSAYRQNSQEILSRDWAKSERFEEQDPMYCYRTLGDVVCYNNPLPKEHLERLKGTTETEPSIPHQRTWKDEIKDGLDFTHIDSNNDLN